MLVLTITEGPDTGAEFRFKDEIRVIIGRGSPQLKLADRMISHAHARLKRSNGDEWYIRDVKSRNGTFVNDRRVLRDARLFQGDRIRVGFTVIRFHIEPDPPEILDELVDTADAVEAFLSITDDQPTQDGDATEASQVSDSEPKAATSVVNESAAREEVLPSVVEDKPNVELIAELEIAPVADAGPNSENNVASDIEPNDRIHDQVISADVNVAPPVEPAEPSQPTTCTNENDDQKEPEDSALIGALAFDQALAQVAAEDEMAIEGEAEPNPEMEAAATENKVERESIDASKTESQNTDDAKLVAKHAVTPTEPARSADTGDAENDPKNVADNGTDTEMPANEWKSVLAAELSKAEAEPDKGDWEFSDSDSPDDSNAVSMSPSSGAADRPTSEVLLSDLSSERRMFVSDEDDASESHDAEFTAYLKEQQRLVEEEEAIKNAVSSSTS